MLSVWVQLYGSKIFWLTVGGAVSVYMTARQKATLTKTKAVGLFMVSMAVGYWTYRLAEILGAGEASFLIGSGVGFGYSSALWITFG